MEGSMGIQTILIFADASPYPKEARQLSKRIIILGLIGTVFCVVLLMFTDRGKLACLPFSSSAPQTAATSTQAAATKKMLSLDDFKLTAELTEAELRAKIGDPDRIGGSGLPWLVYRLKTGEELWIIFDLDNPCGKLQAAHLYSANHMERKQLFGD
jgi:hypothetical protein